MTIPAALFPLMLALQVPAPPAPAADPSAPLHAAAEAARRAEGVKLEALAAKLEAAGAAEARALIEPPPPADGATRFVPLAEVVPARAVGLANVASAPWRAEARAARAEAARALFDLAGKAATPGVEAFALADACLRGVLAREPDHREARRLLGFVPFENGWARPHAVAMKKLGKVADPTFGWVDAAWVPHLTAGELPAVGGRGQPFRWVPAAQADAARAQWGDAWVIKTAPHFEIHTNVPLADAIAFGRKLEAQHELFFALFADLVGPERLPLARRYANASWKEDPAARKLQVWYFASKEDYVRELLPRQGPGVEISLGVYIPPREAARRKEPARSYFYKDAGGAIDDESTLYHEVSHQLLFESAGTARGDQNVGHYWVWEGLGTYFETLQPHPDGSITLGGKVGPRFASAKERIIAQGQFVPTAALIGMGKDRFNDDREIYGHYAESMALAVFLLNGEGGRFRRGFLDYVDDAYRGKFRTKNSGPSLFERIGVGAKEFDGRFLDFMGR